jgi:uncharacterized protein
METRTSYDRRAFLKSSMAGITGVVAGGAALSGISDLKREIAREGIIYRTLGRTGLKLPVVSMGVMRSDNPNLVKAALKTGVVHIDTAHGYQGGRNEEMLGKLLKEFPRDSFIISTKIKGEGDHELPEAEVEEKFLSKFEISIKRLQMDYVDILYLHSASSRDYVLFPGYLRAIKKLKDQGRVRFAGVSTHSNEPEVIRAVVESDFYDLVLTAYNYTQKHLPEMQKAIAEADQAGLGVVAMKTMAGGYLDRERTRKVNARAALKWALQNEHIHTSIPGFTSFDEMEESWSVVGDLTLTEDETKDLQSSFNSGSMYCNGCQSCLSQCPAHQPIPDAMRAYMYAYGYRETLNARSLLEEIGLNGQACADCGVCLVTNCTARFDVRAKMLDIARLLEVPAEFMA